MRLSLLDGPVGSAGNREWNASVWSFDRDDLCGHAVAHSSEVHGSEGLKY